MLNPLMLTQRAYDEATTGTSTLAADLMDAVYAINAAASKVAHSTAAETYRSFECPAANPLNHEGSA